MRRPSLRDERGFTLPELLLTLVLGVIILGAGTMITIGAERHNVEVANRVRLTQEGRLALERMEQLLRSQTCSTASSYAVVSATANSISFYSDLSDGTKPIVKHTLTYDPTAKVITDTSVIGSTTTPQTFTATPKTVTLASNVMQNGTTPVFRYWAYPTTAPTSGALTPSIQLVPSGTGLTSTDIGRIARVDLDFITFGATPKTQNIRAEQTDQVFVRLADPNATTNFDPTCT